MVEKVVFLGTGAGIPTNERNVTSLAVILNDSGDFWLFDCGEGTQQQINRAGLKLSKLKNIFISHLHGDHLFGLPGLLATRGLQGIGSSINIFGPVGLKEYIKNCLYYSKTNIPYNYNIYTIKKENFLTKKLLWKKVDCSVYCIILNHTIDSFGYAIIGEKIKRNIVADKLIELGIKPGPIYRKIKEKSQIILEDGRVIKKDDFVKETINFKKICYCSDTTFTENAIILSRDSNLLIHEATFSSQEKFEAEQSFHSTIEDAIKVAKAARVEKLVLTHISPRYKATKKNSLKYNEYKKELARQYLKIILAEDFFEIKI